jgi:hypothetical protein
MRNEWSILLLDKIKELFLHVIACIIITFSFVFGKPVLQGRVVQLFCKDVDFVEDEYLKVTVRDNPKKVWKEGEDVQSEYP